jgi:hypothetical protein
LTEYPLTLAEIVSWCHSKQRSLTGSSVSLVAIRERTEYLPAASADFNGIDTLGQITGWVSGEFDFHTLRVSDGKDIFWRHADVSSVDELEDAYADFLRSLLQPA